MSPIPSITPRHCPVNRRTAGLACLAAALALALALPALASAAELTAADVSRRISGIYALVEWHPEPDSAKVLRPPQVDGRFTLQDGTITTILRDRSAADGERTDVYLGHYVLDGLTFSYGYDDVSRFVEARGLTSASHAPLWAGLRTFTASVADGALRLTSTSGKQQFVFTADGVSYLENGAPLRKWRRLGSR